MPSRFKVLNVGFLPCFSVQGEGSYKSEAMVIYEDNQLNGVGGIVIGMDRASEMVNKFHNSTVDYFAQAQMVEYVTTSTAGYSDEFLRSKQVPKDSGQVIPRFVPGEPDTTKEIS